MFSCPWSWKDKGRIKISRSTFYGLTGTWDRERLWFPLYLSFFKRGQSKKDIYKYPENHPVVSFDPVVSCVDSIEFNSLINMFKKSLGWWVGVRKRVDVFTCLCLSLCNGAPLLFIIYPWSLLYICLPQIPPANTLWVTFRQANSECWPGGEAVGRAWESLHYFLSTIPLFFPSSVPCLNQDCFSLALSCLLWCKVPRKKQEGKKVGLWWCCWGGGFLKAVRSRR